MMKRFKTILSLVLVFSLMATFMAGCANKPAEDASASNSDNADASASELNADAEYKFDYDTASQFLSDDELIMTVNGDDVYWQEYFFWLKNAVAYMEGSYGVFGWEDEIESPLDGEKIKINESVKELANNMAQYYRVVESYANEEGIKISDEDMAGYEKSLLEYYGSEEVLQEEMKASNLTKEEAIYRSMISDMYNKSFEKLYGTDGSKISEDKVTAYAEEYGYLQAKHILFTTVDEEGNALSDEEKAEKMQKADDVLALLNEYTGDDVAAYFQEQIDEYNEDPGASSNPDGYLFTSGTMVAEFEDAVNALKDYEISGVVETEYGYHIIMRFPVNLDSSPANDNYGNTLRYYAAHQEFSNLMQEKTDTAEVVFADAYETIIPADLFNRIEVVPTDSEATDSDATAATT